MPFDAFRTLRTLREAAIHLRAAKVRHGTTVLLDHADDVLIAGDIHGNLSNLQKILRLADLAQHPGRHLVLQEFVHGTGRYPNGGCTSHQMLDVIAALKGQFPDRVHFLLGNHELSQWTHRKIAKNGETLNELFEVGVEEAYGDRAPEIIEAYYKMFQSMALAVRTPNGVLATHSIPPAKTIGDFDIRLLRQPVIDPSQGERGTSLYNLVWGRDVSETAAERFAKLMGASLLVTGHISCEEGYAVPNSRQLIVDCAHRPAACVLFPAREAITHAQLVAGVRLLSHE